ncbi:MAG: COX15/CtaA family protein [Rhodobacteraceae bacterium]|nr:COX15/CtaA family protein [Paracoccaceae bacterium]
MAATRKLFEEVGESTPRARPAGGMIDGPGAGSRTAVRAWLVALFVLVVVMIAVGGLTRLTDSGLSITEWRPVTGAIPPMSEADWAAEFEKYRASPQYLHQNRGMSLEEFRFIYWWEWGHRQLGRLIGLVWAAGLVALWATRRIPAGWTGRLLGLGVLGGAQGAIGWWMVASGLEGEMVSVASYRLAVHLGLAFVILGLIAWFVYQLGRPAAALLQARRNREAPLAALAAATAGLAFLQILLGALVAGIDAGRGFTDWPLMAGGFLPPDPFWIEPLWRNFFENAGLVQFVHRMGGYLLLAAGLALWWRSRSSPHPRTRASGNMMAAMLLLQVGIGIVTVMHSAPLALALLHQLGAVALWAMILRLRFLALYPVAASVRGGP